MTAKHAGQLCKRCNTFEADLTVRNESLCKTCFSKYIHTKVVKRMEAFRTRNAIARQERKFLLPVSLGISSVALLQILDQHLQAQKQKTGRTGFSLHVLHIKSLDTTEDLDTKFALLKETYPNHAYSTVDVEDVFATKESLANMLSALPSASSVADVLSILRTRLAVRFCTENSCEGIFWGDSTTKLAEKILAETAKGRGFSLPWHVADGPSPFGISFYYPMRDVLKKELVAYSQFTEPPMGRFIDPKVFEKTQAPPSAKNTTIDVLMKQYFEDVEESYPSIVSNVVRTTAKLVSPVPTSEDPRCKLCELPVEAGKMGSAGWGGQQEGEQNNSEAMLCYGCSRTMPSNLVHLLP